MDINLAKQINEIYLKKLNDGSIKPAETLDEAFSNSDQILDELDNGVLEQKEKEENHGS